MDKSPLVSVVVPVYNMESFLPETLDSILASVYPNFEVVVVDDGSKDASYRLSRHSCMPRTVLHAAMPRKTNVYVPIHNLTGEPVQPEIMLSGWRKENLFCLLMQIILSNPV